MLSSDQRNHPIALVWQQYTWLHHFRHYNEIQYYLLADVPAALSISSQQTNNQRILDDSALFNPVLRLGTWGDGQRRIACLPHYTDSFLTKSWAAKQLCWWWCISVSKQIITTASGSSGNLTESTQWQKRELIIVNHSKLVVQLAFITQGSHPLTS